MTYRDANANNLLDTLDFGAVAFREPPTLARPGLPSTGSTCEAGVPDPHTIQAVAYAKAPTGTTLPPTTVAGSTTTTTTTTIPGQAPPAQPVTQPLALTGTKDTKGLTVIGATAVATGFLALAARHRILEHADQADADATPPSGG
jgi:hypothetical protein